MLPHHLEFALLTGTLVSLIACPVFAQLAPSLGLVDEPDGRRKQHGRAIPSVGGPVLFIAISAAFAVLVIVNGTSLLSPNGWQRVAAVALASLIVLVTGIMDDSHDIRGIHKLVAQILAATIVVAAAGISFQSLGMFGLQVELGGFGYLFSIGWIVLVINALNLIDGADGFASTVAVIATAAFGFVGLWSGNALSAILPFVLAASIVGFLPWNVPGAKAFLGDSGSMLIGLLLGVASISVWPESSVPLEFLLAPVVIPVADTVLAICRRKLTGQSLYDTDRAHIHHRILNNGVSPTWLLVIVASVTTIMSATMLLGLGLGASVIPVISAVLLAVSFYWVWDVGKSEMKLLSLMCCKHYDMVSRPKSPPNRTCNLEGYRDWNPLWDSVVRFCIRDGHQFARLNLNLPWCHESFHARYGCPINRKSVARLPLSFDERQIGWVEFGRLNPRESIDYGGQLNDLLAELESLASIRLVDSEFGPGTRPEFTVTNQRAASDARSHSHATDERTRTVGETIQLADSRTGDAPLRICLTANKAWNLAHFRLNHIKALIARGFDVHAVAPYDEYVPELEQAGATFHNWEINRRSLDPFAELRALLNLRRVYSAVAPNLVHHYTVKAVLYGTTACRTIRQSPAIVNSVTGLPYIIVGQKSSMLQKVACNVAVAWYTWCARGKKVRTIFQNREDQAVLQRFADIRPNALTTRGSGVELDRFQFVPRTPRQPRSILFVGRLIREKGIFELIDAAKKLRNDGLDFDLHLCGDIDAGNRSSATREQCEDWLNSGVVNSIGKVDDVRPHLSACDFIVLPSWREGTPRSILEAMAVGRAAVVCDVPGCRSAVVDGETGIVVKAKASDRLAEGMRTLLENDELCSEMGNSARHRAELLYSERDVIETTLSAYEALLGRRICEWQAGNQDDSVPQEVPSVVS